MLARLMKMTITQHYSLCPKAKSATLIPLSFPAFRNCFDVDVTQLHFPTWFFTLHCEEMRHGVERSIVKKNRSIHFFFLHTFQSEFPFTIGILRLRTCGLFLHISHNSVVRNWVSVFAYLSLVFRFTSIRRCAFDEVVPIKWFVRVC